MTWVDALIVLVLACSALIGFLRGFIREALGLAAWIGAGYVAISFFSVAQPEVRRYVSNPEIADPVALVLVFVVALIGFSIVASIFARVVRLSALGGLDRTMGLLFGALRGAALICAAYIGAGRLTGIGQWPQPVLEARSLPYAYQGAVWIVDRLPAEYAPSVPAPPPVNTPSVGFLQAPPHGFALDGREPPHTVDSPDSHGRVSNDDPPKQ